MATPGRRLRHAGVDAPRGASPRLFCPPHSGRGQRLCCPLPRLVLRTVQGLHADALLRGRTRRPPLQEAGQKKCQPTFHSMPVGAPVTMPLKALPHNGVRCGGEARSSAGASRGRCLNSRTPSGYGSMPMALHALTRESRLALAGAPARGVAAQPAVALIAAFRAAPRQAVLRHCRRREGRRPAGLAG